MKTITIRLKQEEEMPFWDPYSITLEIWDYEKFTRSDKEFLEDLNNWLKGLEPKKEAE